MAVLNLNIPTHHVLTDRPITLPCTEDDSVTGLALRALKAGAMILLSLTVVGGLIAGAIYWHRDPLKAEGQKIKEKLDSAQHRALERVIPGLSTQPDLLRIHQMVREKAPIAEIRKELIRVYPEAVGEAKEYIESLARALRSDVDMTEAFEEHGKELLFPVYERVCSARDLRDFLSASVMSSQMATRENLAERLVWMWANFVHFVVMQSSLLFDAGKTDLSRFNPHVKGWDYTFGEKSVGFHMAPNASGDPLLPMHIKAVQKDGGKFLYHCLLDAEKGQEGKMVEGLKRIAQEHGDNIRLFFTRMDGAMWEMGPEHLQWESPAAFMDHFKENAGYEISDIVLSTESQGAAFDTTKGWAEEFAQPTEVAEKVRFGQALQLATQGMLGFGAMIRAMQDSGEGEVDFMQACKMDIDRGGVLNITQRVFYKLWKGETLTGAEINQIAGAFMGRVRALEGRNIVLKRQQVLHDLLTLISQKPEEFTRQIRAYAASFAQPTEEGLSPKQASLNRALRS